MKKALEFEIHHRLDGALARTGTITTPHGLIETPAFIPVGTKATLKALTPEQLRAAGAQAVLVNAYHLYLRPGHELIDRAGGVHEFMHWDGPTFSDSGGFQVMSLGVGFKKVVDMEGDPDQKTTNKKDKLAWIDNDGVNFKSHLDGSMHRFTPELSMQIQHGVGADITFAFDELTTLFHDYDYQVESLHERTHPWAVRSLAEHKRLNVERSHRPPQALFGVVQGADHEDLRRECARFLGGMDFDGYGLGGALRKSNIGNNVRWMCEELPEDKPRHMLGISEPDDIFDCIENGADTFDCVSPARVGRNGALYTKRGRVNITRSEFKEKLEPFDADCDCYTCQNFTAAYLHHLFKSDELLSNTLATIHNERFIVRLVDDIRASIADNSFFDFKQEFLAGYYSKRESA
ncbi:tRNA guanosine(34) transglycosylase Tgt [Candidatus Mycosynbacter amalyticus]|uniref:Queuine tRNA-ribosyltransferase n=1 Tax=Candidatus Mycosynbacter amalyticus TaxID=2665156 RepID=A0A857MJL1_9BACT|nr:tRNA guanosine(34) transglycosylase Tgt [Candidatus Mycosynbacter amalyticus]QHN42756.1 tRNA guanosine(34) transglycosylase Tgt [Candidatus Mycosynbacter amalyticus]